MRVRTWRKVFCERNLPKLCVSIYSILLFVLFILLYFTIYITFSIYLMVFGFQINKALVPWICFTVKTGSLRICAIRVYSIFHF